MNIFIWERAYGVTDAYHDGGAVLVVAENVTRARELWLQYAAEGALERDALSCSPDREWTTDASYEPEVLVFKDSGCC